MPWHGQASGEWTESNSYLRELYKGIHNTIGELTEDAFTQSNPPEGLAANTQATMLASVTKVGVLSGSVAFSRPDEGNNYIGGPDSGAGGTFLPLIRPLGLFINDAVGHNYENTPGVASNRGPYVHANGTYGTRLYETEAQYTDGGIVAGDDLTWQPGQLVYASVNGFLTYLVNDSFEVQKGSFADADATVIGIVKFAPEASHPELVVDLRI